jgi:hypothetical protein
LWYIFIFDTFRKQKNIVNAKIYKKHTPILL